MTSVYRMTALLAALALLWSGLGVAGLDEILGGANTVQASLSLEAPTGEAPVLTAVQEGDNDHMGETGTVGADIDDGDGCFWGGLICRSLAGPPR
jgi:hypothetical protein